MRWMFAFALSCLFAGCTTPPGTPMVEEAEASAVTPDAWPEDFEIRQLMTMTSGGYAKLSFSVETEALFTGRISWSSPATDLDAVLSGRDGSFEGEADGPTALQVTAFLTPGNYTLNLSTHTVAVDDVTITGTYTRP